MATITVTPINANNDPNATDWALFWRKDAAHDAQQLGQNYMNAPISGTVPDGAGVLEVSTNNPVDSNFVSPINTATATHYVVDFAAKRVVPDTMNPAPIQLATSTPSSGSGFSFTTPVLMAGLAALAGLLFIGIRKERKHSRRQLTGE